MDMSQHHLHQLQNQHQLLQLQLQQQQSKPIRNFYTLDGEILPPATYFNGAAPPDQSHPPYIPQFQVAEFAPPPVAVPDGDEAGGVGDVQWNYGLEQRRKRLKEQDFMDNNSQISSVDFLQPRSVSTGLGLSIDSTNSKVSSGDLRLLSILGDEIDRELQRQDAESDRYLKIQGDRLRQAILEKIQADQLQTMSYVEEKVLQKIREKDAEMETINRKNMELEERVEQLALEAGAWQERAKYNENMITVLKYNLQQVYAQGREGKEGCGDSEVDDTASCCNGRAIDFHLLCKDGNDAQEPMICRVCRSREVCMLLLPCKHLCLCKDCESKLNACPMCLCSKFIGMEIYM